MLLKRLMTAGLLSLLATLSYADTPVVDDVVPETRTRVFNDWVSVCNKLDVEETCFIQQLVNVENEQKQVSPLLKATVTKVQENLILQLQLPLGMDLRPGVVMRVDEKEEKNRPYTACFRDGCFVLINIDTELLADFKAGQKARIGFRPFNTEQTVRSESVV